MGTNHILLAAGILIQAIIISACSICSAENRTADGLENSSLAQATQCSQQQDGDKSTSSEATAAYEVITFEPMYITAIPDVQNDYASTNNKNTVNNEMDDTLQK